MPKPNSGRPQPDLAKLFNLAAIQAAGNPGYDDDHDGRIHLVVAEKSWRRLDGHNQLSKVTSYQEGRDASLFSSRRCSGFRSRMLVIGRPLSTAAERAADRERAVTELPDIR
jgi:hypothetical protein